MGNSLSNTHVALSRSEELLLDTDLTGAERVQHDGNGWAGFRPLDEKLNTYIWFFVEVGGDGGGTGERLSVGPGWGTGGG